jgi:hypothetical protein
MLHPSLFGGDSLLLSSLSSQLMLPPHHEGDWHRLPSSPTYVVTPPAWWTGLCGTLTITPYCSQQQPVWTCQSPCLGMAACLWFQGLSPSGTTPCMVLRPKGPVYRHRGHWPFVYVMSQDVAVYCHAGRSSLTSWGMFRTAQAMPGQDVLIAAVLASLAHKSHELIRDVSYHRQTSAGRVHHCSVLL